MSTSANTIPTISFEPQELDRHLGFPRKARLVRIILTPQVAGIWLDLRYLESTISAQDIYPAIRNIARRVDEDCKQMGLVVPVVVAIQPPALDEATSIAWRQMDADTDLNAGEFIVRVFDAASSGNQNSFIAEFQQIVSGELHPKDLIQPVRPRSDADYRAALLESSEESRPEMHTYLLRKCIEPNWNTPQKVAAFLGDLASSLSQSVNSSSESAFQ